MGPKKVTKIKRSKAEIEAEKLLREEEERKAKLVEEKRILDENEKRRLEEIRLQTEYKEYRENELQRLRVEYEEMINDLNYKERERLLEEKEENEKILWKQYSEPNDEPNAKNERDMNTIVTLMNEMEIETFPETLKSIQQIEKVAVTVEDYWSDCLSQQNQLQQRQCQEYIQQFSNMMIRNFDTATVNCLRYMDKYMNEKVEINMEEVATNAKIGLWVSLNETRLTRKALVLDKVGVKLEIPKQLLHQEIRYVTRIIRTPIDVYSGRIYQQSNSNNNSNHATSNNSSLSYVVGDLIHYDLIAPPPQPHTLRAKKWVFRDHSASTSVPKKAVAYPSSVPTKCYIKVADTVVMSDDIRIALWDEQSDDWTEEGLTDYQYSETDRLVQFYITTVGTMALIKSRVIDFPYKSWSLQSMSPIVTDEEMYNRYHEKYSRFTIRTMSHEVVIDILGTVCKLIRPNIPPIADLIGKELSAGQLIRKLLSRGINIAPVYSDSSYITGNRAKMEELEDDVLWAVARSASALDFESSSWNKELPSSKIGILARESTVSTGNSDVYDYECILAETDASSESHKNSPEVGMAPGSSGVKYTLVVGNDYGNKRQFSYIPRVREVSHVNFKLALESRISKEAMERIERGNERFHHSVYKLLKIVKPFSF